ncbi:MAG TPA: flagellar hook capping FlgD N-terminal domain-containing protein [Caulobacteraceae bacterium]|jgi:flagellar basal-body rod modification protein FlgD
MTDATNVLSGVTAQAASSQVNSSLSSLTSNFQSFLSLLTTQLQDQDPTSPVDPNQFTQQIVQMTGVQQQLLTNNLLTTLVGQGQSGMNGAVSYIGKEVMATSANQNLSSGSATWDYQLASNAASATMTVTNSLGQTVYSGAAPSLQAGLNQFTWNGKTSSGAQEPDGGPYTLSISAVDANGSAVTSQSVVVGQATSVQMDGGSPYLTVNGQLVPMSSVVGVTNVSD